MTFQSPLALLSLLVLPVLVGAYVIAERRRARSGARFGNPALLPNLIDRAPGWRRHLPIAILLLALATMLVGLARPQAALSVPEEQATVVLAVDTSRSMAAKDVRPTRLDAARRAMQAFVTRLPRAYRVGVVSFASTARVAAPATHDRDFVRRALAALAPGEGTALGDALALSLEVGGATPDDQAHRSRVPVSVLLLSDGVDQGSRLNPMAAAQRARALGVPVHAIAFGTPNGVVHIRTTGGYVEHIQVPPSPATLRQIAQTTGGRFFSAASAQALQAVYAQLGSRIAHVKKPREITYAFAGGAVALLLVGGGLSALWFRRLP